MAINAATPKNIAYFTGFNGTTTINIVPSNTVKIVNDTVNNPKGYTGAFLWVTGAGNAVVVDAEGNSRTLTGLTLWQTIPFPVCQVMATGTTATFLGIIPKY